LSRTIRKNFVFSNLEVVTKHFARTEWHFLKQNANCFRKIICEGRSGSGIVKQIGSPLVKESPPLLHCRQSERLWVTAEVKLFVVRFVIVGWHRKLRALRKAKTEWAVKTNPSRMRSSGA
jgi:hypothetical protein